MPSEIYVDPSIAANSGTGTVGDPFGDIRYAIEQTTFDTVNGTRVNVKSGAVETLTESLDVSMADVVTTVAWVPSNAAHVIIQGYTAVAGDGGMGILDGDGLYGIFNDANLDYIDIVDMELRNTGSNSVVLLDNNCTFIGCEIHGSTFRGLTLGNNCLVHGNYIYDVTQGLITVLYATILYNIIDGVNFTNKIGSPAQKGISVSTGANVAFNVILVQTAANGIETNSEEMTILHNSIFGNGSTGSGIVTTATQAAPVFVVSNNIVEGFSGVGGIGIEIDGPLSAVTQGNAVYDCATAYSLATTTLAANDNETLSATPFTDAALADMNPVDTGSVKEGALPANIGSGLQ